jgi:hypothetical protein
MRFASVDWAGVERDLDARGAAPIELGVIFHDAA